MSVRAAVAAADAFFDHSDSRARIQPSIHAFVVHYSFSHKWSALQMISSWWPYYLYYYMAVTDDC